MDMMITQQATASALLQNQLWLVTANRILGLASDELHTLLQEEVEANPALELEERTICLTCGRALDGARCSVCAVPSSASPAEVEEPLDHEVFWQRVSEDWTEERDHLVQWVSPGDLYEALTLALRAELPPEAAPVIEYLVGNLDENGYLRCTLEEAVEDVQAPLALVGMVLRHLQAQEPSGIGARTLQECLLLQVQALDAQGRGQPYAAEIIEGFLEALAKRHYAFIARELGIKPRQVEQISAFLKRELTPFPARGYVNVPPGVGSRLPDMLVPQVVIRRQSTAQGNRYAIEVVEAERFHLRVSPAYLEAYQEIRSQPGNFQAADRDHLQQHVSYARLLIISLRKRWQTLGAITRYLVEYQQAFLEQGNVALRPLTRVQVATALGVHPSTISRAVADKYVLLPNACVVPFSTFFEANLPIKEALRDILAQETRPLSDQRLTEVLATRGLQVARRTVAKYREELRVPASSWR